MQTDDVMTRLTCPQVRTFRGRVHLGGQEHFYMEPHAVLVVPSGEKDELTVHASTQDAMTIQVSKIAMGCTLQPGCNVVWSSHQLSFTGSLWAG